MEKKKMTMKSLEVSSALARALYEEACRFAAKHPDADTHEMMAGIGLHLVVTCKAVKLPLAKMVGLLKSLDAMTLAVDLDELLSDLPPGARDALDRGADAMTRGDVPSIVGAAEDFRRAMIEAADADKKVKARVDEILKKASG